MPTRFEASVTLRGANEKTSTLRYDLGEFNGVDAGADFVAAVSAINQVVGALEAVTDAEVAKVSLSHEVSGSNAVPAAADVFEYAVISVHLAPLGETAKYGTTQIPAPSIEIFEGATGTARDIVDLDDATLQQYIQQLEQHTFLSDGEQIQAAVGTEGMSAGRRVVRSRKLGS